MWQRYSNPNAFMRLSGAVLPVAAALAVGLFGIGLYLALYVAPGDFRQGDAARIMFVHVPAAALSIGVYAVMALASLAAIIWRHPVADLCAKSAAPVGAVFTALALVTGAVWGKPMWGAWWVWDARLTSELILFFFYIGYMALWSAIDEPVKAARAAAIFCLVGSIFAVLAKYSVHFWDTLHQSPSLSIDREEHMHDAFFWPLLVNIGAFYAYFVALLLLGMRMEIRKRRVRAIRLAMMREGDA